MYPKTINVIQQLVEDEVIPGASFGFIKNNESKEYIFAFIVNNFDGNPGAVREKMWKILNLLK